ncbi:MarR family transcriptional regulator [Vibrio metschnikovii]|uniref:MarR family transcriptional regulator n=1 Tax=bacterium 19MO02SH05 TaxID=2920696 RepID=A0AAU6TIX8_UNCXX|nr:MarR family transcriptional regulator [Vibrio metschnikovii]EKO3606494.1 MarR family transcriptional regulator [Vibrio metschnikovii]EKO3659048.1 MarR family transcriptional regulator [Vibrio metschnikovii]EKO3714118.1 MarR family transcriptional regulator [Vibrio metschnikovii]EKO3735024.1 MarR family transcriptional regulator [Vibrio metschnikovii]
MINKCMLWLRVKIIVDSVENQIAKDLQREYGLGLTEYRALGLLSESEKSELRMQELARLLGLNQSSVTRLVERLEKGGYTIRDICPNDKRGVYTVLTGRGRDIQEKVAIHFTKYLNDALNAVALDSDNKFIVNCLKNITIEQ